MNRSYYKYLFFIILIVGILFNTGVQAQTLPNSDETLENITNLLDNKEFDKAEEYTLNYFRKLSSEQKFHSANFMLVAARHFFLKSQYLREEIILNELRPWLKEPEDFYAYYRRRASNSNIRFLHFEAMDYADSSAQVALALKDTIKYLRSVYNKALNWSDLEIPSKSIALCNEIITYKNKYPDLGLIRLTHLILGYDLGVQKKFNEAIQNYSEAQAYYEERNDITRLYFVNLNLSDLYTKMSRFDDAEYYSLKALAYSHEYDDPSDIIFAYRFLSKINANRNQFNKANAYLDTAKMVAKDYKLPYMLPGITVFQIANEIELENYQKVGELIHFIDTLQVGNIKTEQVKSDDLVTYLIETQQFEKAKTLIDTLFTHSESILAPYHKMSYSFYLNSKINPKEAAENIDQLIAVFNQAVSTGFSKNYYQALYSQTSLTLFNRLVNSIIEGNPDPAFVFKMSEFIKGINSRISDSKLNIQEPDSILIRRKQLEEFISKEKLKNNGESNSQSIKWQLELDALAPDYKNIQQSNQYVWEEPLITDVQNALTENSALIHFLQIKNKVRVVLIDKESIELQSFDASEAFQKQIDRFKKAVSTPNSVWNFALTDSLTEHIFGKLTNKLQNYSHLIISSDGILSDAVFSAFSLNGKFLGEKISIQNMSTFEQAKYLLKNSEWSLNNEMLIVSNPSYPSNSTWSNLPFSKIETSAILNQGFNAIVLSDTSATKTNFTNLLSTKSFRFYHIAAHGVTDADPNQNRIIFSYKNDELNGVFFPNHLKQQQLPAELVVLSSCETADGTYITGEGLWSMQKAWFIAGAQTVIASLWKVNDKSSAIFMEHFYSDLKENDSYWDRFSQYWNSPLESTYKLKAFHSAQKFMVHSKRYSHPYYWAAYQYYGL